jgi:hypothetical protein
MNKLIIFFSCFFLVLLFDGCGSDYTEELSNGYFYRNEGRTTKDILSHRPDRRQICGKVISYDYNADFIIALQEPSFEQHALMLKFDLSDDFEKYSGSDQDNVIEEKVDSIMKNDVYYKKMFLRSTNYWIIANRIDSVIGPLSETEYLEKRRELRVPRRLKLKAREAERN